VAQYSNHGYSQSLPESEKHPLNLDPEEQFECEKDYRRILIKILNLSHIYYFNEHILVQKSKQPLSAYLSIMKEKQGKIHKMMCLLNKC
jgi:hypothetical protein